MRSPRGKAPPLQSALAQRAALQAAIWYRGIVKMAIYHCSVKIIGRSSGRSAVASAAYRVGEKLKDKETGIIHDYTKKGGVIYREVMLCQNAPKEYQDRETLWNEVQKIEKVSNAQLAREIEVALPIEMSRSEQIQAVQRYVREKFVSAGMCADWALHDKGDGNPHAHIMLTTRPITVSYTHLTLPTNSLV